LVPTSCFWVLLQWKVISFNQTGMLRIIRYVLILTSNEMMVALWLAPDLCLVFVFIEDMTYGDYSQVS